MARRQRRRRRRRRHVPFDKFASEFAKERSMAALASQCQKKLRAQVDCSKAQQRALTAKSQEKVAFFWNLPFQASAAKLAEFLKDMLPPPQRDDVRRCEILRTREGLRSAGRALVTLSNSASFEALLELAKSDRLVFFQRSVRMKEQLGAVPQRQKDAGTRRFAVDKLVLASSTKDNSIEATGPLDAKWSVDVGVEFEVNGRNKRQIAIEFSKDSRKGNGFEELLTSLFSSDRFRVEFPFKSCSTQRIFEDGVGRCVFRIRLSRPPLCFRRSQDTSFQFLLGQEQFLWDPSSEVASEPRWERTTDPTGGAVFAHCLVYDLVLGKTVSEPQLHQCLNEFSLPTVRVVRPLASPSASSVGLLKKESWSGGFDNVFAGANLPFDVAYLLHAVIAAHRLVCTSEAEAVRLAECLNSVDAETAMDLLEDMLARSNAASPPPAFVDEFCSRARCAADFSEGPFHSPQVSLTRRVLVTPLRVCPQPPEADVGNRVLRLFPDHADRFVRVTFCDENFGSILQVGSASDVLDGRVRRILKAGLVVAGRRFVFLAFSNSQLREQSCWMYDEAPRLDDERGGADAAPSAASIRGSIGDLSHISFVGKRAARLGQAFSTTISTVTLSASQITTIADVERGGFCFSDGVGIISEALAKQVSVQLDLRRESPPSAFQIRLGGSKGVVTVSNRVSGIQLRPSMTKFEGNQHHRDLEICSYSRTMPCYLNRQIITVLSALGIPDGAFLSFLHEMICTLDAALTCRRSAYELLCAHASSSPAMKMLQAGVDVLRDRHLLELVACTRDRLLVDVQQKARILVPKGVCLVGVLDESGTLTPEQVFFQTSDPVLAAALPRAGASVAVGRCPCMHPGDIRVLTLAEAPALSSLVDVIVFSKHGSRPQPNMMSGGDLDGDIFFAIWEPSLVPTRSHPPMQYDSPPSSAIAVESSSIEDFFVDYIKNDRLGVIANAHVVFADISEDGARSEECMKLAELHSTAVDFCKTGIPAEVPTNLRAHAFPDFMNNQFKSSYESRKVLGKIYRLVRGKSHPLQWTAGGRNGFDARLLFPGYQHFEEEAQQIYLSYCYDIWDICCMYEVWTEAELVSGFVRVVSRKVSSRRTHSDASARLSLVMADFTSAYRDWFWAGLREDDEDTALAKASAWYKVAYTAEHTDDWHAYLSFAWIASEQMCKLAKLQYLVE